jgi:hypothetical protein
LSLCIFYSCKEETQANRIENELKSSIIEYYKDLDSESYKDYSYLTIVEEDKLDGYRLFRMYDSYHNLKDLNELDFYREIKQFKVLFKLKEFNYSDSILKKHIINNEFDCNYDSKETMIIMNDKLEIVSRINHTGYRPLDSLKKEYSDKFKFLKK